MSIDFHNTPIANFNAAGVVNQGGPLTAPLDCDGFEVVDAADPTTAQSLVTRAYGDANYGGATLTPVRAFGSSTSGTPGTSVADLQATALHKLVAFTVYAGQTNAANTSLTVTVTYADATTTTLATGNATAASIFGNAGGAIRTTADAASALIAFAAKDVTRIQVTTLGTGAGTRVAAISALEAAI